MALEVIGIEGQVTAGGAARGPATTLNLRNGTAYVAAAQPAGTDTTFQAGDIVVYLHSVEHRKNSVEGPATGNIHNTFNHTVQISINGGTAVNMVDIGYFRGGNSNRQASGAFAYTLPSGQTLQDIVVSHQISNQAGNDGNYGRSFRLLVVRGAEPDYDSTSDLGVVVSNSSLASIADQESIEWEQPSHASWTSTNYNSGVGVIWFASYRKDSSGVDPTQNTDPDPQNPTNITRPTTSEFTGSSAGTGDGGFETNVTHANGHAAITYFQMGFLNYAAINGVWANGNTYGFVTDENDTNGGAGLGIFFREAATSQNRTVTPGTASVGTVTATADVAGAQPRSVIVGTHSLGEVTATASVSSAQTVNIDVPTSSVGEVTSTASVTAVQTRSVQVPTSSLEELTATASVASAQTRSVQVPTSSVEEVTATASVSASQQVDVSTGTVSITAVTSTASVSASQDVGINTGTSSIEEVTATASVSAGQQRSVQVPSSSVGEVTATASVTASQTVGVETSVSIGEVTGTASVSASQDVGVDPGTSSIGEVTATSSVSAGQQRSVQVPTSSVGEVTATASVTAAQTVDIETTVSIGEVTGTASVSASQDVGVNVPTSSIGTVTATATVVTSAEGEVVPGTSSVGEVTATASVTAGQARGINVPTSSIGVVTGTADADASQDVGINVPASSVIGFSATAGVSTTSVVTIETSTSFGQVSATASVQIKVPDHVLSVTIDGVGDIVENLLTRSEIVAIEEIWNTGLTQLGVGRVDSAEADNSAQAALLRAVWPNFRKQFISDHAWNGCKTTAELTALPDSDFKDTTRWSNIFSLPSDYIRALTVNGHRNQPDNTASTMWEIEVVANTSGTKSRCLCTNQSSAKLEYVFDVGDNVDLLAPAMKHAMGLAFGAFVAPNFGKSANEIALLEQKVKENLLKARGIDGQESSGKFFSSTDLVDSRYRSI